MNTDHIRHELVAAQMIMHGGSFVEALGLALLKADHDNATRIRIAFPEYWEKYVTLAVKANDIPDDDEPRQPTHVQREERINWIRDHKGPGEY